MQQYSGVLIKTFDNSLLLQQRDSNFGTFSPGKIAIFGGSSEGDESPEETAVREIWEEVGLKIQKNQLQLLGIYHTNHENVGGVESSIFLVEDVDATNLSIAEGESIFILDPDQDLKDLNLTQVCRLTLNDYLNKKPLNQ